MKQSCAELGSAGTKNSIEYIFNGCTYIKDVVFKTKDATFTESRVSKIVIVTAIVVVLIFLVLALVWRRFHVNRNDIVHLQKEKKKYIELDSSTEIPQQ